MPEHPMLVRHEISIEISIGGADSGVRALDDGSIDTTDLDFDQRSDAPFHEFVGDSGQSRVRVADDRPVLYVPVLR